MTEVQLVIRAQRALIDGGERPASVAVADGVVVGIGHPDAPWDAATEVTLDVEQVLIPGIVDTHVHVNEPGRAHWEGFSTATRAAAAGGVTTFIDMPLSARPPTTTPEALALKRSIAAKWARVNVGFWGGAVPSSLGHLSEMHERGVFGFKAFLAPSGVDEFPYLNKKMLRRALAEIAEFDGLLIVHAEDPWKIHDGARPGHDYAAFEASRPPIAETTAITVLIDAMRETGTRAHILHLSTAEALPLIRAAKDEGLPLTVETCPHYLTFDAAHIADGATQFTCCPPIRSEANREALWEALVDGTIDLVSSGHSPATVELKFAGDGDFGRARAGIAGLEVSLPAVWTGASARGHSLADVVRWMSSTPAQWAGLASKGAIRIGADADLVAFAPEDERVIDAAELLHRNKVSAFDGRVLMGNARSTWVGGVLVHGEGAEPIAEGGSPVGKLLTRRW
ncbi:MAG: allantoinase AllB [Demequinaceae bacterium]|nr:allantoinase AllB [Demequinaceae bacterium]